MENKNTYSKNFLDIYSNSHVSWGILFGLFFKYLNFDFWSGLYLSIILSVLWEIFENTEFIICVYRKNYGNYTGDSFINILGDIMTTIIGYLFVQKTFYGSILFLIITEILLIPYKATILQLSFGSLLKTKNLLYCL